MPSKRKEEPKKEATKIRQSAEQSSENATVDITPSDEVIPEAIIDSVVRMTSIERQEDDASRLEARYERQASSLNLHAFLQESQRGNVINLPITSVITQGKDVYWVCISSPFMVYVPFDQTFEDLPVELLDDKAAHIALRRTQVLQKAIGLTIPVVITSISNNPDGEYIAYGSCTKAMQKIRRRYFGDNAINPVKVNDVITGTVSSVGPSALWVMFRGVCIQVPNRHLSHRYMSNLGDYYHVGDQIKLKVTSLSTPQGSDKPEITVSGLPIEWEKAQKNLKYLTPGGIYAATVCSIRSRKERNQLIITLWIEGINVPAYCSVVESHRYMYYSGDRVLVEFYGVSQTSGYPIVKIKRTL